MSIGAWNIVMNMSVQVCVCPRSYLGTACTIFAKFFMHVTYGHVSFLLGWYNDMLRISGFMNDVIFAHKLRLLDVAARLRQWGSHAALGLACRYTRCKQWMLGTTSCSQGLLGCSGRVEHLRHHVCTSCPCIYIARRKWCVLKVTTLVATPGAESAVYDSLVFSCVA